ncbi:MAG: glycosyltransferase [Deltaproteobacteria bacterium]|nr:glycosyltransferase [Deltaproteobacteria bacterium]
MTDPRPWLSVLMPVFNGAHFVRDAVASIPAEAAGVELVVADDGSTDDTVALIERTAGRLPCRVLRRSHDGNWVAGTNQALRAARGRFACVLHQDDAWLPGRLPAIRAAIDANSVTPRLVTHEARFIDVRGLDIGPWRCPLPTGAARPDELLERLLVQNFFAMPSPTFERDAALEGGGFDEGLWFTADWDLWLRLGARFGAHHLARPLAAFRVHPQSQTVARARTVDDTRRQLTAVLDRHLASWARAGAIRLRVERAARFSIEVNARLAAAAVSGRAPLALAVQTLALGPRAGRRYLRDSRIVERVVARLRAQR